MRSMRATDTSVHLFEFHHLCPDSFRAEALVTIMLEEVQWYGPSILNGRGIAASEFVNLAALLVLGRRVRLPPGETLDFAQS